MSCARPTLTKRGLSTYSVLGFIGYGVASVFGAVLMARWQLAISERLVVAFAPPLALLAVVTVVRRRTGRERIVFYETAVAGVLAVAIVGIAVSDRASRMVDIATLGIGVFLVFGRLGCYAVACCHGRPARRGVRYSAAHVAVGLWAKMAHRPLWPVQLVESAASLALVVAALALGAEVPGAPATIHIVGYGACRFALELVRGDPARPYRLGLSSAQWTALATVGACAAWQRSVLAAVVCAGLAIAAGWLVAIRHRRALLLPTHLHELDTACTRARASGDRQETQLAVGVSHHRLPDGRSDWVLSSEAAGWTSKTKSRIAGYLWPGAELVSGRVPGLVHAIEAPSSGKPGSDHGQSPRGSHALDGGAR